MRSAQAYEEVAQLKMYQLEQRYGGENGSNNRLQDIHTPGSHTRTVSVTDEKEYQKLQEKLERITLKKTLYDRKQLADEGMVVTLNEQLNLRAARRDELNGRLEAL